MDRLLRSKYATLQQQWEMLFLKVEGWPDEKLNQQPQPGKWSAAQIMSHLILSERLIATSLTKKIHANEPLEKSGLKSWYRSVLLKLSLRSSLRFKAPRVVAKVPEYSSLSDIEVQWHQTTKEFEKLLENFPSHLLGRAIFTHPIVGRISLYQTIDFMADHVYHHLRQINRILHNTKS